MPARRSGYSATKSASQRLCARMPARRAGNSSGVGGPAITAPVGKNGGTVLGKTTSAAEPSASISSQRRSLSQLRTRRCPWRSENGFL